MEECRGNSVHRDGWDMGGCGPRDKVVGLQPCVGGGHGLKRRSLRDNSTKLKRPSFRDGGSTPNLQLRVCFLGPYIFAFYIFFCSKLFINKDFVNADTITSSSISIFQNHVARCQGFDEKATFSEKAPDLAHLIYIIFSLMERSDP